MPVLPILITRPDGTVVSANDAAEELLEPEAGARCDRVVAGKRGATPVCNGHCASGLSAGEQVDHGVVSVDGAPFRLVCTGMGDQNVITMIPARAVGGPQVPLTAREREVLALVAQGLTNARIARRLGLSAATVRTHLEHIRTKLGARTRAQALARAIARGDLPA